MGVWGLLRTKLEDSGGLNQNTYISKLVGFMYKNPIAILCNSICTGISIYGSKKFQVKWDMHLLK